MRRRPADPQRTRSVLLMCAALAFTLAVVLAAAAFVLPVRELVFGDDATTGVFSSPVPTLVIAVALVALGLACLRLAGDDGRGSWCERCVERNAEDATTCANCGALLG